MKKKRKTFGERGYKTLVNKFNIKKMTSKYHKELLQI